jgi:predicted O-methyltransferase YrrM
MDISAQLQGIKEAIAQQNHNYPFTEKMPYTMLAPQETAFLHALAADYYKKRGKILDLGCFLGGSTYALASGLYANDQLDERVGLIHSFDLFLWDTAPHDFLKDKSGFKVGDSFLESFKETTRQYAESIQCFPGDFLQYPWSGEDIEILFIDISKHPTLNDFLVQQYFPSLLPGAVIIQQDFQFPGCFWLLITMEYFRDHIELVGDLEYNSRIYVCKNKVPVSKSESFRYDDFSYQEKHELLMNHLKTIPADTNTRCWLAGQINLGLFYYWEGQKDLCQKCLSAAAAKFDGESHVYDAYFSIAEGWSGLSFDVENNFLR